RSPTRSTGTPAAASTAPRRRSTSSATSRRTTPSPPPPACEPARPRPSLLRRQLSGYSSGSNNSALGGEGAVGRLRHAHADVDAVGELREGGGERAPVYVVGAGAHERLEGDVVAGHRRAVPHRPLLDAGEVRELPGEPVRLVRRDADHPERRDDLRQVVLRR